jgi:hypothetical protein
MRRAAKRPEAIVGLLAEPERLRVFAAVVLGAETPSAVAERTGLQPGTVVAALRRLQLGGLIAVEANRFVARVEVFKDSVRANLPTPDEELEPGLRPFVVDGRLLQLPANKRKRRLVLEHIAACFEPGVKYPERAVNAILRAWYADHASLRRYLVDEQLLSRDKGVYWRSGGPVDL